MDFVQLEQRVGDLTVGNVSLRAPLPGCGIVTQSSASDL